MESFGEKHAEFQCWLGIQAEDFADGREGGSEVQAQVSRASSDALGNLSFALEIWITRCVFHKINCSPQKYQSCFSCDILPLCFLIFQKAVSRFSPQSSCPPWLNFEGKVSTWCVLSVCLTCDYLSSFSLAGGTSGGIYAECSRMYFISG